MTRCEAFYKKWKRDPNWCDKCPSEVSRINKYIETLDAFPTLKTVSAGALRPVLEKKVDIETRRVLLEKVVHEVDSGKEMKSSDIANLMKQLPIGKKEAHFESVPQVEKRIIHAATWKEQMHPVVSRMDEAVYDALSNAHVACLFQETIPVKSVTPDVLIQSRTGKSVAVFLDGPVHEGREDRDSENRQLLAQRGVTVLEFPYQEYSTAARDQIVNEILDYLGVQKEAA